MKKISTMKILIPAALCLFLGPHLLAQRMTTVQVFSQLTAYSVDRYSYKEHLTDDRVTYAAHHLPVLGIGAVRTTDRGYWGLGLAFKRNRTVFSYKIHPEFRDMFGFPMEGMQNLSFTSAIEQDRLGVFCQYYYKLNESIGLKGSIIYDFITDRGHHNQNCPDIYPIGFGREIGDISYSYREYDLLVMEKKPLQQFSFYLGGVYQPVPSLEFSFGANYLPVGSLLAERKEFMNDELNSHLEVWDRHLNLVFGIAYTFIRKTQ